MDKRLYVVLSAKSGTTHKPFATLRISGEWLNAIGFMYEKLITIGYENGYLVLRAHEKGLETYNRFIKEIFEKKLRMIQIGQKKKGNLISPTFDLKGRWFEDFGFTAGTVVCAIYEYGIIRLKVIDVDKIE